MDGYSAGLNLDGMVEQLYNLDRGELRRLAYEALLISDGPDRVDGDVEDDLVVPIVVEMKDMTEGWNMISFTVVGKQEEVNNGPKGNGH
jgi:hypothetical protein